MHQGEIRQTGTPAELRASLHARRMEIHTSNLGLAERTLSAIAGPDQEIIDVQRFGDRLDMLVYKPEEARRAADQALSAEGLVIEDVRIDEPTLENTFVATLRNLGQRVHDEAFPGRRDHRGLRGKIAIGATNLTKQFGSFTAVKNVTMQVRYGEIYGLLGANGAGKTTTIKMLCGLLPPTRGDMQLAGRARQSPFGRGAAEDRLHVAEIFSLRRLVDRGEPRILRRRVRCAGARARRKDALGDCFLGAGGQRSSVGRQPAAGMETACGIRRGDPARTERPVSWTSRPPAWIPWRAVLSGP